MEIAPERYVDLLLAAGRLKRLPRSGWLRERVADPESVAEHSYRVALLALLLGPVAGVDTAKVVHMALLHDLGEVITGDLVTHRGREVDAVAHAAKEKAEREAMEALLGGLPDGAAHLAVYDELVAHASPEARLVKQLDKLEMALQALEYEDEQDKDLAEFFATADSAVHDPLVRDLLARVMARRAAHRAAP